MTTTERKRAQPLEVALSRRAKSTVKETRKKIHDWQVRASSLILLASRSAGEDDQRRVDREAAQLLQAVSAEQKALYDLAAELPASVSQNSFFRMW